MDFVAIDFETANASRSSACALGIAVVTNGWIATRQSWLIRPPELNFAPFHTAMHGIGPEDVVDQPTFADLWPTIEAFLDNTVIAAHNAAFDRSVLAKSLDCYGISPPRLEYVCTLRIAKAVWPRLLTYNLKALADFFGLELRHHDPVEDAAACAEIAIRACKQHGVSSLRDLSESLAMHASPRLGDGRERTGLQSPASQHHLSARDIRPSSAALDAWAACAGRAFVFTGTLCSMNRSEAMQRVVDAGGQCSNSVTKATDFVVVGGLYSEKFDEGYKTGKLKKAASLIECGADLEIITEDDFLKMLQA